jgi:hypothetical protein
MKIIRNWSINVSCGFDSDVECYYLNNNYVFVQYCSPISIHEKRVLYNIKMLYVKNTKNKRLWDLIDEDVQTMIKKITKLRRENDIKRIKFIENWRQYPVFI